MKEVAIILLVMVIVFIGVIQFTSLETTLFYDGFEYYLPGSSPTPTWEFWFNTNGEITDTTFVSPSNCLLLLGSFPWSTEATRKFTSDSVLIGYEVYVRVEKVAQPYTAAVGFMKRVSQVTSRGYAFVWFRGDGEIISGENLLQTYVANRWYKIRVLFNRDERTYHVWVDDILVGPSIRDPNIDPYAIEDFTLSSEWAGVNCYFDDVRIFSQVSFETLLLKWAAYTGIALAIIGILDMALTRSDTGSVVPEPPPTI